MVQVLADGSLSTFEETIITKLSRYHKPVKTKHLANKLKVDRSGLVPILNHLEKQNKITYTCLPNDKDDHRGREDKYYGWVLKCT